MSSLTDSQMDQVRALMVQAVLTQLQNWEAIRAIENVTGLTFDGSGSFIDDLCAGVDDISDITISNDTIQDFLRTGE